MTAKPDAITTLLATAAELYEREITPLLVAAYRAALAGIGEPLLLAAFQAHIADPRAGSFFPKPADILRHVKAAATRSAEAEFDALMHAACFGYRADVSRQAAALFHAATAGASSYDVRLWKFERWDRARQRFLEAATAPAGEHQQRIAGPGGLRLADQKLTDMGDQRREESA